LDVYLCAGLAAITWYLLRRWRYGVALRGFGNNRQAIIETGRSALRARITVYAMAGTLVVLAGLVAMRALPISQYPQIVPPEVIISATYPGATAETVAASQDLSVRIPEGRPDDPPGTETIAGLSNQKNDIVLRRIREDGVEAAWRVVDPVLGHATPPILYDPCTWGPREAEELIVNDGVLQYLPFAALPTPETSGPSVAKTGQHGGAGKPLIIDHEIVTLPSATVLATQRKELAGRPPGAKLGRPRFAA